MSLLEKAKAVKKRSVYKGITTEDFELAFAWLRNEITGPQIAVAYDMKTAGSSMVYRMAIVLKEAYRQRLITIKET